MKYNKAIMKVDLNDLFPMEMDLNNIFFPVGLA